MNIKQLQAQLHYAKERESRLGYDIAVKAREAGEETTRDLQKQLGAIRHKIETKKREVSNRVYDEHKHEMDEMRNEVNRLTAALTEAMQAQAQKSGLNGVTLRKREFKFGKWTYTTERAIVEVVTDETKWPKKTPEWRMPQNGSLILRSLKANGTPGLRVIGIAYVQEGEVRLPEHWVREDLIEANLSNGS